MLTIVREHVVSVSLPVEHSFGSLSQLGFGHFRPRNDQSLRGSSIYEVDGLKHQFVTEWPSSKFFLLNTNIYQKSDWGPGLFRE